MKTKTGISVLFKLFLPVVFALVLLFFCAGTASAAEGDFKIDSNGVLTEYKGSDEKVVIPSNVRVISASVFSSRQKISSVTIPEGVTEIGNYAFNNCSSLKEVHFPQSLERIGLQAFANNDKLAKVELPDGLEFIGENVEGQHEAEDCECHKGHLPPDALPKAEARVVEHNAP